MDPTELPLRDLHLPNPVGWWPLAPGWWFLIALALALMAWMFVRACRAHQLNAPRRYAIRTLAAVEAEFLSHRNCRVDPKPLPERRRRRRMVVCWLPPFHDPG